MSIQDGALARSESVAQASRNTTQRLLFRHKHWLVAGTVGLILFAVYLDTLAPSVLPQDSGRFQARAYVLGIGHPTGYPTYIMLGKLFTYLPVGDIAYRVNLSSAVYAACGVVLLYLVASRLTDSLSAALAALAFGVSRTFWREAVIAEVYTLNAFFLCAVLLSLVMWRERRSDRYLLLAAFLTGLSLTNHLTSALLVPCGGLFVWLTDPRILRDWRLLLKASGLFVLGLAPYLYLPIRASMDPPLNTGDPSSLPRFIAHVTGRQFSDKMWAFGITELSGRLDVYWDLLLKQYHPALLVLGVIGAVAGWWRDWAVSGLLLILFVLTLIYGLEYDVNDAFVYFIPTYLVMAVWLAFGIHSLLGLLVRLPQTGLRTVSVTALAVALLLAIGQTYALHGPVVDASKLYAPRRLIDRVAQAPPNATIYDTENTSVLQYMTYVEGSRPDITIVQIRTDNVVRRLDLHLPAGRHVYFLHTHYRKLLAESGRGLRKERTLWRVVECKQSGNTSPVAAPTIIVGCDPLRPPQSQATSR